MFFISLPYQGQQAVIESTLILGISNDMPEHSQLELLLVITALKTNFQQVHCSVCTLPYIQTKKMTDYVKKDECLRLSRTSHNNGNVL